MNPKNELRRFLVSSGIPYTETEKEGVLYSLSFSGYSVQMGATLDRTGALIVGKLPFTSNRRADVVIASLHNACSPDLYGAEYFIDSAGAIFVKASVSVFDHLKPNAALFRRCFDTVHVAVMMALPELSQLVEQELLQHR